ncbi:MAG: DUF1801 domain-containing protein [Candidatus Kapaibacteriota bacterium]|jgi:hypothetical protein
MTKKRPIADEYFALLNEPQKSIALEARALVLSTEPDIQEEMKYGVPFYVRQGMICYLNVNKSGVMLGFMSGTQMSDSFELFSGKSLKLVRHIALPSIAFIHAKREEITNYVIEAIVINDAKSKK